MTEAAVVPSAECDAVAVICGGGSLPFAVADALARRGRRVVLFPLQGWADPERATGYRHHWTALGKFGRFCRIARAEGCRDVVFIGSLVRPAIWQLRPDLKTFLLLPRIARIFRGGDDYLLTGIASIFEEHGFHLVGAHEVVPEILMPEGVLGGARPGSRDEVDIRKGFALLRAISPFDVGQAAVVANGRVLAIEGAEGTDGMLARVAQMRRDGRIKGAFGSGVLVKAAKYGQDRRIDLPTIGPQTIEHAAQAGLAGIAITAGSAIIAEPERIGVAADRRGLFVVGLRDAPNDASRA